MKTAEPSLTEKAAPLLSLDLTDTANVALAGYAGRIATLLTDATVLANTDLAASLDDFLGAVYALIQAKRHGFADRTGPVDITAVEKRARMIAAGKVRLGGKWMPEAISTTPSSEQQPSITAS